MQRIILFDLDGTLTDPGLGITNSVIYALDKFGISVEDRSELEGVRNTKGKVITYALKQYAEKHDISMEKVKENAIMVGDRFHDIHGAKENGIESIGVLYGYGNGDEFEQAGADYIVEFPKDIIRVVNGAN